VDIVVGTSIGAVNGWFVATAQYSRLKQLWQNVAAEHLFQIKPQYRAVATPSSGILTRVFEAAMVSQGLTSNVTGLLDGSRILAWLNRNIDPDVPVVVPLLFSATNLEQQRSELFYRLPYEIGATTRTSATDRLQSIFGERIVARELSRAKLTQALAGSTAIPIVFDPVKIEFEDGAQTYVDGGIADSAPLDLARSGSRRIQLVLVDPPNAVAQPYPNAAAVGFAAFGIAQSRILDESLRSTYIETSAKRLFDRANLTAQQQTFFENVFDADVSIVRPSAQLAVSVAGFDDADGVAQAYDLGRAAGEAGFTPYAPALA
jgi:predicted acylesterase/phospholipase RssA